MKTIQKLGIDYLDHLRSLNYSPATIRQVRIRLAYLSRWLIEISQAFNSHDKQKRTSCKA